MQLCFFAIREREDEDEQQEDNLVFFRMSLCCIAHINDAIIFLGSFLLSINPELTLFKSYVAHIIIIFSLILRHLNHIELFLNICFCYFY